MRGQEQAKRALEIAAAGAHNILFVGPPGAGKSMLAQRLAGLLPPLSSEELLEVSMLHSVAGLLERGRLTRTRPFRAPHHSASMAALVGGGLRAKPDLALPPPVEGATEAAARVTRAREAQSTRGKGLNAVLDLEWLESIAAPDAPGAALLSKAAESLALSARAYHRTLKVARTIADLDGSDTVRRIHVAEALSLKRQWAGAEQGAIAKVS